MNSDRILTCRQQSSFDFQHVLLSRAISDICSVNLRHCFNTNARKAGIHDHVIMAITGHTTLEMFERYDTVDEEDILDAMKKLEEKCSETAARENDIEEKSRK